MSPKLIPTFRKWLMVQVHRADSIGTLAWQWVVNSQGRSEADFLSWLQARREGVILAPNIEEAEAEYDLAIDDIQNGRKTGTFPSYYNRPEREQEDESSHTFHHENPDIDPSRYLHILHLILREEIKSQKVFYIDTCHWVKMRHSLLDDPKQSPIYNSILERLRQLRREQKLVCPVSFPLFVELMKQSNPRTRFATAQLMDELSNGICLQSMCELIKIEIRQQIERSLFQQDASDYVEWIWTKSGFITGETLPSNPNFSEKENTFIQKCFLDQMWQTRLEDLLEEITHTDFPQLPKVFADAHNQDAAFHHKNKTPFQQILAQEKGLLFHTTLKEPFSEIAKEYYDRYRQKADELTSKGDSATTPNPLSLPIIQITAGINAMFIHSRESFTLNDLTDAEHASIALPYCDFFFCDGPLAHKLTSKPLQLDKTYGTVVISKPELFHEVLSDF